MPAEAPLPVIPRGRHNLSRETVAASQRARLRRALVDELETRGYHASTVSGMVKRARVSREAFYEHYSSKEECFWDAHAMVRTTLAERVGHGLQVSTGADPLDRFAAVVSRCLAWLEQDPALARCLLLERPGRAGERALAEDVMHARATDGLLTMFGSEDRAAASAAVVLVRELVAETVAAGRGHALTERTDELVTLTGRLLQPV